MSPARPSLLGALGRSFQWRMLLLWVVALSLPTALAVWPLWRTLSGSFDHALAAGELARRFDVPTFADAAAGWGESGRAPASGLLGALTVTLLLSPWLAGMALAAAQVGDGLAPGFASLWRGGIAHYGRLARLLVWSAVPLGIVAAVAGGLWHLADERAHHAVLASDADLWRNVVWVVAGLLLVVVHAGLENARVRLVREPDRRSAVLAWWRANRALARRPIAALLPYVVVTALGFLAAASFGLLRLHVAPLGFGGFLLAWIVAQGAVVSIAWMRCARLFALYGVQAALEPPATRF